MLKHLYLIVGSTFIFGLVTGVIISLATNTGGEGDGGFREESGFAITARMYGGCAQMGTECPSYRVSETGEYTYVSRTREGEFVPNRSTLSKEERTALKRAFTDTDFALVEKSVFSGTCPITYDGVAYTYEIESDDGLYTLDSCKQKLDGGIFLMLETYFANFSQRYAGE